MRRLHAFVLAASIAGTVSYVDVARANDETVIVHVESPKRVVVQRRDGDEWEDACASPCDSPLARDAEYRVVAPQGRPSDAFRLAGASERVVLRVDPWGGSRSTAGGILIAIGATSVAMGAIAMLVQSAGGISFSLSSCADAGTPDDVTRCQQYRAQQDAATRANANGTPNIALIVTGVVFLVGGFVLSAHDTTTVAQTTPPEAARRAPELHGAGWSAPKPKIATSLVVLHF